MRYAIFSDIHNNATALAAVLNHAGMQQVDGYFCLGDVGVDACVNMVRQINAPTVFGNWEVGGWRYLSAENQAWALNLPPIRREEQFWLTHAAPLWPAHIITLADLHADRRAAPMPRLFPYLHHESQAMWDTLALLAEANVAVLFHGHTHRQLGWRFTADNRLQKLLHGPLTLRGGETWLVGVGSVGRPVDGPKAAYAIFDTEAGQIDLVRV